MESLSATSEQSASQQLWLMLLFEPTSLFSLRMTHATNKGGRTLLLPTPYAFKLALVDAAFRAWPPAEAPQQARVLFKAIAPLAVRFSPPNEAVVQHTFIKVRQEERDSRPGIYNSTIAFREFVYYRGTLIAALPAQTLEPEERELITKAAAHVQYMGKRGSFFQYVGSSTHCGPLPPGFTTTESPEALLSGQYGSTQYLDDFSEKLTKLRDAWERVSTYGSKSLKLGEDRTLIRTLLPYRVWVEGHSFTAYKRMA